MTELKSHVELHPSVTTEDFDVTPEGKLIIKLSPASEQFQRDFDKTPVDISGLTKGKENSIDSKVCICSHGFIA